MEVFPNPAQQGREVVIRSHSLEAEKTTCTILDVFGKTIIQFPSATNGSGEAGWLWHTHGLQPGAYFIMVKAEGQLQMEKIILTN